MLIDIAQDVQVKFAVLTYKPGEQVRLHSVFELVSDRTPLQVLHVVILEHTLQFRIPQLGLHVAPSVEAIYPSSQN